MAITPTARAGYIRLGNGRCVVALGDAHVVNDPIIGQGANTAVHAAWTLGAAIREARHVRRGVLPRGGAARLGLHRASHRRHQRAISAASTASAPGVAGGGAGIRSWRMATPGVSTTRIVSGALWPVRRAPPRSWPILPAMGASHPASESLQRQTVPERAGRSRRRP